MAKQKLQWLVQEDFTVPGLCCAELWDRPYVGLRLAATRLTRSKSQARKDGRKVFAAFEELKDA